MKKTLFSILALAGLGTLAASYAMGQRPASSDAVQNQRQEQQLQQGTATVGIPAIRNWREKRLLKSIYELRDQELRTYTYLVNQATGKPVFFCDSVGFAINDATGFTNPERIHESGPNYGYAIMPQAEPNGLYTPSDSNAYWVMCLSSEDQKAVPVFVGTPVIVSPSKLH